MEKEGTAQHTEKKKNPHKCQELDSQSWAHTEAAIK